MTDLDVQLAANPAAPESAVSVGVTPRKCRRHQWRHWRCAFPGCGSDGDPEHCGSCWTIKDPIRSKRNRNNGKRGRAAELVAARVVNGRKVGPMGWPWDVEMTGYARLQIKKLARPPSMRDIAGWLADIDRAPGVEMPGVIWIEPGRGGQKLIVFRLRDFAERHGTPTGDDEEATA